MPRSEIYKHAGQSMTLKQWAAHLGIQYKTLWMRLRDGMPYEKAFATTVERAPVKRNPEKTLTKVCLNCSAAFVIPKSRDWREHCCSPECKTDHKKKQIAESRENRTRTCKHCGKVFIARQTQIDTGGGNFCSVDCHRSYYGMEHLFHPEVQKLAAERLQALRDAGKIKYRVGAANPNWRGGTSLEGTINRQALREGAKRRRMRLGKKKLPPGTVERLLAAQRKKCPICRIPLRGRFHLDHIMPLARGGQHEPTNIQLLCPPCNQRKHAKDPIRYIQERGYLL